MNRTERRRLGRHGDVNGTKPTQTVDDFLHLYTLSFVVALDSEYIDKEKVVRILKKVKETAECLESGHINKHDVEVMCNDVYGINFVTEVKKNMLRVADDGTIIGG